MARSKAMEFDRIERPLRQMRNLLKLLPDDPAPEQVHMLRTRARRIEAVAAALEPVSGKAARQLVKAIRPVRKAAGGVRDMDVLTQELLAMPRDGINAPPNSSLARLVEHLSALRRQCAGALIDTLSRRRKSVLRKLKKFARTVESAASGEKPVQIGFAQALASDNGSGSPASKLIDELRRWPKLNERNIHSFRVKIKELRYVLQLFPDADQRLVAALGKAKDEIGDWHDWRKLRAIAQELLDRQADKMLLRDIRLAERRKFERALASAETLRRRYLQASGSLRKAS